MRNLKSVVIVAVLLLQNPVRIPGPGGNHAGSGGTLNLGITTQSGTDSGNPNFILFTPFITPSTGTYTISDLKVYFTAVTNAQWGTAIYDATTDGNGKPNNRLCQAFVTNTPTNNAFNSLIPSGCGTLSAGKMYWVAQIFASGTDGNGNVSGNCSTALMTQSLYQSQGSTTFPNPMTGSFNTYGGGCVSQYVAVTCVAACGSVLPMYTFASEAGQTNGTTLSNTNLTSETNCLGTLSYTSTITTMKYSNAQSIGLHTNVNACGVTETDANGLSVDYDSSTTDKFTVTFPNPAASPNMSVMFYLHIDGSSMISGDTCDLFSIAAPVADSLLWHLKYDGTNRFIAMERSSGATTDWGKVIVSTNSWLVLTMQFNSGGTHHAAVYETATWTQMTDSGQGGNFLANIPAVTAGNPGGVTFGFGGSSSGTCGHAFYANRKIDPSGAALMAP